MVQKNSSPAENERITVFHALRDSKILPPQEKTVDRLQEEGQVFVAAGSETTAKTLTIIFFHLLDNPMIFNRLRTELESAPGATSWNALQQLPYLSAVISEGLRLDFGITGRNQVKTPSCVDNIYLTKRSVQHLKRASNTSSGCSLQAPQLAPCPFS